MRIFVYEYLTAVGLGRDPDDPLHSMYREGRAMRDAVAADFASIPAVEAVTLDGENADRERETFLNRLQGCGWCLVIAPEIGDELGRKCTWVREAGVRLLGPDADAIRLASDKLALARVWQAAGVPIPATLPFADWRREPRFPAVVKPVYGAGSTATFLLRNPREIDSALEEAATEGESKQSLLVQSHVPGRAASVAFLVGPKARIELLPADQHLSNDGRFRYRGGAVPIAEELAKRAVRLARDALECVPGLLGYVGIDLVLGHDSSGSADFAIEINPRLTTSYVGLRALADFNLAEAMLRVAEGREPPPIRWKSQRVHFDSEGCVEVMKEVATP